MYTPNNGVNAPQQDFTEGIFIDYRGFDKRNETPIYEFGYGLSYTTFGYSNLQVQSHGVPAYNPTTGNTPAAPTYGSISNDSSSYVFPANIDRVEAYIYAYLNSSDLRASSGDPMYGIDYTFPQGSSDSSPQPYLPAGSKVAPGGNQALYDVLFTVTATITNTGKVPGEEVPQLYVSLGGPNDAKVVLRGFDRLSIQPGQTATFSADITRRDLSNWDTAAQNWLISSYPKTVYVGSSSRKLPLSAPLNLTGGSGGNATTVSPTSTASGYSAPGYSGPSSHGYPTGRYGSPPYGPGPVSYGGPGHHGGPPGYGQGHHTSMTA